MKSEWRHREARVVFFLDVPKCVECNSRVARMRLLTLCCQQEVFTFSSYLNFLCSNRSCPIHIRDVKYYGC